MTRLPTASPNSCPHARPTGPPAVAEPPVGDPAELLALEARALLDAASRREPISAIRAHRFARAVIESLPSGPAALAVLDGGVLAGARLVTLAGAVLDRAGKGALSRRKTRAE